LTFLALNSLRKINVCMICYLMLQTLPPIFIGVLLLPNFQRTLSRFHKTPFWLGLQMYECLSFQQNFFSSFQKIISCLTNSSLEELPAFFADCKDKQLS
jgi:hypothetical protein